MKTTMVIPTYWARKKEAMWQEGDAVYDHPTPIDGEDTLLRTLESIKTLENKNFKLIIPICPTADEIEEAAEKRVREIIKKADLTVDTYIFTQKNLREIKSILVSKEFPESTLDLLNLKGYSNVRNICLYASHILGAEVTILIDDDEVFENPKFVDVAKEFIGKRVYGKNVYGVAGYYLNKYDEFYDDVTIVPWMTYWNRFGSKTKAFDKIIASGPRLKVTPFAFGGLMVIHRNMYQVVAFDPDVTRGEDIDYLLNAKMFGFDFFLDNELNIKHLPPKKNHPIWKRFREDIYRFLYQREKIRAQYEVNNMTMVEPEDFDPYPGDFLKDDLEDKIYKTNVLLGLEYMANGDKDGTMSSLENIYLSKYEAIPNHDPFTAYRKKQRDWAKIIEVTSKYRTELRKEMETNNLSKLKAKSKESIAQELKQMDLVARLQQMPDFSELKDEEIKKIIALAEPHVYQENDCIFKEGDRNLGFHIILRGCVRIVNLNDKNDEVFLGSVCTDGVLGETSLFKERYNSTCFANEDVELLTIHKDDIEKLIEEDPKMGSNLLYIFMNRLYYKLHNTNKLYREKIKMEEDISTYS